MSQEQPRAKKLTTSASPSSLGVPCQLEARYESQLESLQIRKEVIDHLLDWIKYGGSALAVGLALLGWWFGNSYSEATSNAQKAAASAFEREFFRNAENAKDFAVLREKYDSAIASLAKIESDLKGYAALRGLVGKVERFDPLELYSALGQEIDLRSRKTREFDLGRPILISETTYDPAFRQKAAYIFERLLSSVKDDAKSGRPKVEVVTLFNAAANAAKVDMDFVSLELMEAAVAQDKSKAPENEARLIRQRLTMSRISQSEAHSALQSTLRRTTGFNLHHVLSEAFNIGLRTAMPAEVAQMIMRDLPDDLKCTSYAHLTCARLLYMGHRRSDWSEAEVAKTAGLSAFAGEPKSVRWYEDSLEEVERFKN